MLRTILEGITFGAVLVLIYISFLFLAATNDSMWQSWVMQ